MVRAALSHEGGPDADLDADQNAGLDADLTAGPDADFEADLRVAVERGELRLAFQPEFDLVTRRIVAAEALLRWQHPRYGELGPQWFLAFAERTDLIRLVGAWVIESSIAALAGWIAAVDGPGIQLRVNISPSQLVDDDVVARIAAALERHHVSGSQVCIEVTEHAPLRDIAHVADVLRRLKRLGVSSAIDDLTMGHSTLSDLRVLPVDILKLDRSLVIGIDADSRARAIVRAVVGLAADLGASVVAEGVQNDAEVSALVALGCTRGQGHALSRPLVADGLLSLLRHQVMCGLDH